MKLSVALTGALVPAAHSCGVLVHNLVVQRASYLFSLPTSSPDSAHTLLSSILTNPANNPAIQAGAFFPDWGYKCLPSSDAPSEAAHWPPFLLTAAEYITTTYGPLHAPRSQAEQAHLDSLLAFILAAASHQVADATWHSIRLATGLMNALAAVDFEGDYAKAHIAQDFGADFIHAARMHRLPSEANEWVASLWEVPVKDIMRIYELRGWKINPWLFRQCMVRGLAALRSELVLGEELMPVYVDTAPMLMDEVDEYYLGGVREMAARTVGCWRNLTSWFVDGGDGARDDNGWGLCDIFQAIAGRGGAGEDGKERETAHRSSIADEPRVASRVEEEIRNVEISVDNFGAERYTFPALHIGQEAASMVDEDFPTGDPTYISAYVPFSHMGSSLVMGNFSSDNSLAIAVGSPFTTDSSDQPHEGDVLIIPWSMISSTSSDIIHITNKHNLIRSLRSDPTTPRKIDQRFSASLAAIHIPDFPYPFLAVSAPGPLSYDPTSPPHTPFSSYFPAGSIALYAPGSKDPVIRVAAKGADIGGIGGRQFGASLASGQLDTRGKAGWVVIGSPRSDGMTLCRDDAGREQEVVQLGAGEVTVLRIEPGDMESVETYNISFPQQPSLPECSSNRGAYPRFGMATEIVGGTLFVTAPGVDGVFAYRFSPNQGFRLISRLTPPTESKSFGNSIAGIHIPSSASARSGPSESISILAVAAPHEAVDGVPQVGVVRVYLVHHTSAEQGENTSDKEDEGIKFSLVATLVPAASSRKAYTRFGWRMKFHLPSGSSAEEATLYLSSGWALHERGAVWSFPISVSHPIGTADADTEVPVKWAGIEAMGRLGDSLDVTEKGDVVVGVPGSGAAREVGERWAGAVGVFKVGGKGNEEKRGEGWEL